MNTHLAIRTETHRILKANCSIISAYIHYRLESCGHQYAAGEHIFVHPFELITAQLRWIRNDKNLKLAEFRT